MAFEPHRIGLALVGPPCSISCSQFLTESRPMFDPIAALATAALPTVSSASPKVAAVASSTSPVPVPFRSVASRTTAAAQVCTRLAMSVAGLLAMHRRRNSR